MTALRCIEIDGNPYLWRELVRHRREQRQATVDPQQPALFELREDCRPAADCTAAGRYPGRPCDGIRQIKS